MSDATSPCNREAREFGGNIAARRRQLGLSQAALADRVGITQVSLSRMESGLATPKFIRLRAFADALHCSVSDLFTNITETEKDRGLIFAELIHPLPSVWQDTVLKTAMHMVRAIRANIEAADNSDGQDGVDD